MKTNENGRSMIEMLGVLAIMGILTTSGVALYSKALYQRKVSSVVDQASELMTNIKNVYVSRRNFDGLDSASEKVIKYKIIPNSIKVETKTTEPAEGSEEEPVTENSLTHAMGGRVKFAAIGEDKKTFEMTFADLDITTCIKLAVSDWGEANKVCASSTESNCDSDGEYKQKQLSAAQAATACRCPNETCSIRWRIKK